MVSPHGKLTREIYTKGFNSDLPANTRIRLSQIHSVPDRLTNKRNIQGLRFARVQS
jgi:hypothetical protein